MAISKIILNGVTQMDVTGKTVTASSMLNGVTALKNDGTDVTGSIQDMTLPSASSSTSSGTSKATITPGASAQYLNIPTGYNGTAQYYTISAASGGGGKNWQIAQTTNRASSSTATTVSNLSITVNTTGTYNVYWAGFRSSTSGTSGAQLFINDSAYGSENTTFTNHIQSVKLTGVSLTEDDVLTIKARSRGSNYYMYVTNLVIEQTS